LKITQEFCWSAKDALQPKDPKTLEKSVLGLGFVLLSRGRLKVKHSLQQFHLKLAYEGILWKKHERTFDHFGRPFPPSTSYDQTLSMDMMQIHAITGARHSLVLCHARACGLYILFTESLAYNHCMTNGLQATCCHGFPFVKCFDIMYV